MKKTRIKIENIPTILVKNWNNIIQELSKNNWEHFLKYSSVKEKFSVNEFGEQFESAFCDFYRLNGPRGLNTEQKTKFFEMITKKKKWALTEVLMELYKIPQEKLHLSFSSKFLHTHDNKLPIYDNNVAWVLGISRFSYPLELEDRIQNRNSIYKELQSKISNLLQDEEVLNRAKILRTKIEGEKGISQNITDEKLLDSILWALYSVLNPKKKK